jgi:hypothetical protein
MSQCTQVHLVENGNKTTVLPHEYIAGICITGKSTGTQCFMRSTYPDYQGGENYQKSKSRKVVAR